jgi:hypothetical protein
MPKLFAKVLQLSNAGKFANLYMQLRKIIGEMQNIIE